jgi:hypothetical protein
MDLLRKIFALSEITLNTLHKLFARGKTTSVRHWWSTSVFLILKVSAFFSLSDGRYYIGERMKTKTRASIR